MQEPEENLGRPYTAPNITVFFDARRCIHARECVRGLPNVFDKKARPWIRAERADAESIAAVVRRCPTGALHYELAEGDAEQPDAGVTIEPRLNGPLFVRDNVTVRTAQGDFRDTRMALCRCGQSGNKPFCDGSHAKVDWRSTDELAGK